MNPKVKRAITLLKFCIIDLLINNNGKVSLKDLEKWTGLLEVGNHITAEVVSYLARQGILNIEMGSVTGDVKKLKQIKEKELANYPENHNKLWDDESTIMMCEMANAGEDTVIIAETLKRGENAIRMRLGVVRNSYKTRHLIDDNKAVREYCERTCQPKPHSSHNRKNKRKE